MILCNVKTPGAPLISGAKNLYIISKKLKKGDTIKIMAGKDNGKSGKIGEVDIKKKAVLVPGLNVFKKHKKPARQGQKGEIISVSRFIPISNVQLLCGSCDRPTRVGFRFDHPSPEATAGQGKKIRFCKKCKVAV